MPLNLGWKGMKTDTERIPSLDGIRAVSISLVIISHYMKDIGLGDPLDLGSLGVRIFFIISGSLITGLLLKELERDNHINLLRFYFRRTMRIFPAFYFYLACMLLIGSLGWTELSFRDSITALTYTSNYSLSLPPIIKHTWSLATEEQFYLIWPAVLAISKRPRGIHSLMLLLILAPLSSHIIASKLGRPVPAFFNDPIGIGCLLALGRGRLNGLVAYRRSVHSQFGIFLPFLILVGNLPILHRDGIGNEIFSLLLNFTIAFWLDWMVSNPDGLVGRYLNSKCMIHIGLLSYSLYLWQQPFLGVLDHLHPTLFLSGHWKLIESPVLRFPLMAICTLISYYLIERPMLRVRTRIESQYFAQARTPATQQPQPDFQRIQA